MERREFIKKATVAGIAGLGALNGVAGMNVATAETAASEIIVAHGGEPEALLKAGLEAYGGLKKIVKPGMTVVIKANFSWVGPPEQGCNNNPDLLVALIKACQTAGAKKVRVVDIPIQPAQMCLEKSGIRKAVQQAGGEIVVLDHGSPMTEKDVGELGLFKICNEALKAECLINVPILKHHRVTEMTGALKNMMGLSPFRGKMHGFGIHQTIADLAKAIKPDLHIIDAYRVLKTNGPAGPGETALLKQLIITNDPVAGDTYGASLLGVEVPYIKLAAKGGLGVDDLKKIKVTKVKA
ncbi:MAG TPA: DUF362 domain-containing protein [Bacillota bacterium]|nr:DUF362 domain-containing protein [Bacillota bacterium]